MTVSPPWLRQASWPEALLRPFSDAQKREIVERLIHGLHRMPAANGESAGHQQRSVEPPPWVLEQFFDGQIDLEDELGRRFHNMPVMATIKFRALGAHDMREMASLAAQDGSAQVTVSADRRTRAISVVYTLGGMLSLRFQFDQLSNKDRVHWLNLVRRETGGLAFLWSAVRWNGDYLICDSRRYFTNLYAFSPRQIEAAARLTPDVATQLFDWLADCWQVSGADAADDDSPLLSW